MSDLAEMKRQYPHATEESHMLVEGRLHLRCKRCHMRPVPRDWSFVCMCDQCLSETTAEAAEARP